MLVVSEALKRVLTCAKERERGERGGRERERR
jgi:hypothetical protein